MPAIVNREPAPGGLAPGAWAALLPGNMVEAPEILRAIVRMSPLPMVLTDPSRPDDPLVFTNRAFDQLTGYAEGEMIGQNCRFLQGLHTDPDAIRQLSAAVRGRKEAQVELWNYRKDGSAFWNSMFVGPVFGGDGTLLFHFGAQVDATARRHADQAKAHTQRMDTLGSMAAGMAHEFNNLMTVVVANVDGIAKDSLNARHRERLGRVDWAAREAGRLTRQMLNFAGHRDMAAQDADLNDVLRGFDRLLTEIAPAARVRTDLCRQTLRARLDIGQLELALINLVRNAADASPPGAAITVATRGHDVDGQAMAEIAVIDHGTGMQPGVAAKAAEAFFTTKLPGAGTGLGLSVVAGFCQQSGGGMVIESQPGQGTTIRLRFPRLPEDGFLRLASLGVIASG
jgi:PAS domain S-box-containing protein